MWLFALALWRCCMSFIIALCLNVARCICCKNKQKLLASIILSCRFWTLTNQQPNVPKTNACSSYISTQTPFPTRRKFLELRSWPEFFNRVGNLVPIWIIDHAWIVQCSFQQDLSRKDLQMVKEVAYNENTLQVSWTEFLDLNFVHMNLSWRFSVS